MTGLSVTRRNGCLVIRCGCCSSTVSLGDDDVPAWGWLALAFVLGAVGGFVFGVLIA
jgi:hypothetical protein